MIYTILSDLIQEGPVRKKARDIFVRGDSITSLYSLTTDQEFSTL